MVPRIFRLSLAFLLLLPVFSFAQRPSGLRVIDDANRVPLHGNVHPLARPENDRGPTDSAIRMEKIVLVLGLRRGAEAELERLIAAQHDPKSPEYQKWLTPEEFGMRFGMSDQDLADITGWLQSHGFVIDEVAAGRRWINFSGTVAQVEQAFQTQIHEFQVNGKVHHANASAPSVPAGLADVVLGIVSLHDFRRQPMHSSVQAVDPQYTSGSSHYLAPGDFAAIYNVNPLYSSSINGTGQTIAVVGRTDINLADVQNFRSYFGLPANDPVFVHNGTDPGNLGGGEETEADLDVQWAGAVAKNATVKLVISKSTSTTDGVDLSAQYIVNNNVASIMTTSFGSCEQQMGSSEMSFWNSLWSQAAAQGITAFVSSGDSGAAGCQGGSSSTGSGRAVNGLCSTPYNVCVGGTQFMDTSNPGAYWGSSNNSTTKASALGYIPEQAWNESGSVSGGSGLWATGGGVSTTYAKPTWQNVPGVPADGKRDVPDVSFSSASHDGYLVYQGGSLYVVGGTSAASPSWASTMALVLQKVGARQGNANTTFYKLASNQYASGGAKVFHDVTTSNNTVPGVTGFAAVTAYDQATGLGSADANALVNNWSGSATTTPDFTVSASPSSLSVKQGTTGTTSISTAVSGGFNASVALSASGAPAGTTVSFSPVTIAAPGQGTSTMSLAVGSTTATGSYAVTVTATGGGKTHTTTVTLTVTSATSSSQLLGNPGFENGSSNPAPWAPTAGVIDSSTAEPAHSGSWKAWLDGYGTTHTDTLYQQVTIPSTATSATLTFWLHIDTAETTTTTAYDRLQLQIRNSSGIVLATLGTWSNLNRNTGYAQQSFNLLNWKGQTVRLYFVGTEDSSLQTSFVIDDTALNVQ